LNRAHPCPLLSRQTSCCDSIEFGGLWILTGVDFIGSKWILVFISLNSSSIGSWCSKATTKIFLASDTLFVLESVLWVNGGSSWTTVSSYSGELSVPILILLLIALHKVWNLVIEWLKTFVVSVDNSFQFIDVISNRSLC